MRGGYIMKRIMRFMEFMFKTVMVSIVTMFALIGVIYYFFGEAKASEMILTIISKIA